MGVAKISKIIFICLFVFIVGYNVNLFYNNVVTYKDYSLVRERIFSFENVSYCTVLEKQGYLSNIGNIMFRILFLLYIRQFWPLIFSKAHRSRLKKRNSRLDKLRSNTVKNLKDQKEFLNIRYPKKPPFVWSWRNVGIIIFAIFKFMITLTILGFILTKLNIFYPMWFVIMMALVVPYITNLFIERYGYKQDHVLGEMLK